jgi:hypothetical protein
MIIPTHCKTLCLLESDRTLTDIPVDINTPLIRGSPRFLSLRSSDVLNLGAIGLPEVTDISQLNTTENEEPSAR